MSLEWRAAAVDPGGDPPSPPNWTDVGLPGRPAQFAGADAVAYRTTFDDPRQGDDEHVTAVLDGVYAEATAWLNGERIGTFDDHVAPWRLRLPVEDHNELIVECRSPADRFGGLHDTDRLPPERCVPGIWWDARLETYPDPYLASMRAEPGLLEDGPDGDRTGAVDVRATIVTDEPIDDRVTLSLRPEGGTGGGMMERASVDTDAGTATVSATVTVRDPSLWWPHERGDQPRYVVRAKFDGHERTQRTGLRSIAYEESEGLIVNGETQRVRGFDLLDPDPADVDRAIDANATIVRATAGMASPSVYEACDDAGLFLWQDLPLTGPGSFDVERGRGLAQRVLDARSHHPSLAAMGVHDAPAADPGAGLGAGTLDRLRHRWRAWRTSYDPSPAREVAASIDGIPTFPVIGPVGTDPDAVTLSPGWTFGDVTSVEWLCNHYDVGTIVGGFGAGSLGTAPDSESLSTAEPDGAESADEPQIPGFDVERHAARVGSDRDSSQEHQASVVRGVAERLRRRNAEILLVDALRDVSEAGTGVVAADGSEKAAYDAVTTAFKPVQVILDDPSPGESDVIVLYDQPTGGTLTVEWDVGGDREQTDLHVDRFARATATTLDLEAGDDVTLAVALDEYVASNEYVI